jgi:hypothetical protein
VTVNAALGHQLLAEWRKDNTVSEYGIFLVVHATQTIPFFLQTPDFNIPL